VLDRYMIWSDLFAAAKTNIVAPPATSTARSPLVSSSATKPTHTLARIVFFRPALTFPRLRYRARPDSCRQVVGVAHHSFNFKRLSHIVIQSIDACRFSLPWYLLVLKSHDDLTHEVSSSRSLTRVSKRADEQIRELTEALEQEGDAQVVRSLRRACSERSGTRHSRRGPTGGSPEPSSLPLPPSS
jgi:hypothetical protein